MVSILDFIFAWTCLVRCFVTGGGNWPRPQSLVFFFPFDNHTGLADLTDHYSLAYDHSAQLMTAINGPFGQPATSFSVSCENNCYIGYRPEFDIPLASDFTVSFYFYTRAEKRGAIFCLHSNAGFAVNYLGPNKLEIWAGPGIGSRIGLFPILKPSMWNFFAITYSRETTGNLTIYDAYGNSIVSNFTTIFVPTVSRSEIAIGITNWATGRAYMKKTDAIACLMYYETVLSPSEIARLPEVCRTKGQDNIKMKKMATTTTSSSTFTMTDNPKTTTGPFPEVKAWPRPASLLGFWPLTSQHNFNDVGPNHFNCESTGSCQMTNGPFGEKDTAVKLEDDQSPGIFTIRTTDLTTSAGSFTITLFLSKAPGNRQGGIFEFLDKFGTPNAFQFRYENETTIEVSASNRTIGHFAIVQQKGVWTFLAFVFNASNAIFSVYGKHGLVSPPSFQPFVWSSTADSNNNGIRLGYASRWNQALNPNDSVSCLGIYSVALTGPEIRQVYDACRILHGSSPCGSPKLPLLPAIPPFSLKTALSQPGQFPYIAVLRFGTLTCSASIIDPFWLVTSVRCFTESMNPAMCQVYIGQHDLSVTDAHTQIGSCSKIISSGNSSRDIALIELSEPIDFTSNYANDACLFNSEIDAHLINLDDHQFVFGWGKNGRQPMLSGETLPRYFPGLLMSDVECLTAWTSDQYVPGKDFCFLSSTKDRDIPCSGDEGSPILAQSRGDPRTGRGDRLVQIGFYYQRHSGCLVVKPALFADIKQYSNWIAEKIACAVPGALYPDRCPQA